LERLHSIGSPGPTDKPTHGCWVSSKSFAILHLPGETVTTFSSVSRRFFQRGVLFFEFGQVIIFRLQHSVQFLDGGDGINCGRMNVHLQDGFAIEQLATFFDGIGEYSGEFLGDTL